MDLISDVELRDGLSGVALPAILVPSTKGGTIDLESLTYPRTVIYCYPRTSVPGEVAPTGWDIIPGARGCTPQACTFRDHHKELSNLAAEVFGLSTRATAHQAEMAQRLHLPFPVLSDDRFAFTDALGLPTFEIDGMRLLKQLTMTVCGQRIKAVFYPVPRPEQNARAVLVWLREMHRSTDADHLRTKNSRLASTHLAVRHMTEQGVDCQTAELLSHKVRMVIRAT